MTPDAQLRNDFAAIVEPQLVRTLGELGFLGAVEVVDGATTVEFALVVVPFLAVLLVIDTTFFFSTSLKIAHGGWFPLALAARRARQ